jgi:hypothetical protein
VVKIGSNTFELPDDSASLQAMVLALQAGRNQEKQRADEL